MNRWLFLFSFLFLISVLNSGATQWAIKRLKTLTLEQKIGQLFVSATVVNPDMDDTRIVKIVHDIDQTSIDVLIKKYHIGGVLFLGKTVTPQEQLLFTRRLQKITNIPLFIAQDLEWGLDMRLKNVLKFPHNMTLGAIQKNDLIYQMGKEVGRQCKLLGVNINLSPVVDVNNNPKNPIINNRSFGEDKENVAQKSIAFMRGLQDVGIIACAKHFPGHGDTDVDSHLDLPKITHNAERLKTLELYPFAKIIEAGIKSVMIAHLEVPALEKRSGLPSTLSGSIVTDLLKKEMGFQGLVITDALNMKGVLKNHEVGTLGLKALLAGNDILLCPWDTPKAIEHIKTAIQKGIITEQELDAHVLKILQAKEWLRKKKALMLEQDVSTEAFARNLHTPYTYELQKKLYQDAITVVRDDKDLLPLVQKVQEPVACLYIGEKKTDDSFVVALEAYMPMKKYWFPLHIDSADEQEMVQKVMHALQNYATVVIAVHGMNKYAHKKFGIASSTLQLIKTVATQKNTILVLFGNPYSLPLFDSYGISSVVLAYEDRRVAHEAAACIVADDVEPKGKLPVLCDFIPSS